MLSRNRPIKIELVEVFKKKSRITKTQNKLDAFPRRHEEADRLTEAGLGLISMKLLRIFFFG